jgi:4,5-dihydroxyphthalate decarboxylase
LSLLPLNLACNRYDRTQLILSGHIVPEGTDLNPIALEPEEMFWRQLMFEEFDVSEMSLSAYTTLLARGDSPWVGIPVFLSRVFRHSCIYVRKGAGITEPADLNGRRIGVPEYHMTAAVYARGLLQHEYGVDLDSVTWVTGGQDEPNRPERITLPEAVRVTPIGPEATLSEMILAGELDALITARKPAIFSLEDSPIERLFPNHRLVEEQFLQRTGIFPIMHLLVIRKEIVDRNPWLPVSLYKAFAEAKAAATAALLDTNALAVSLPWMVAEAERMVELFGGDFWPYGVAENKAVLEAFCGYMFEQRLTDRLLRPEDLFSPSTLLLSHV